MKKIVWTFGLISGAILSALMVINMTYLGVGYEMGMVVGYTTMVLAFLLVFFGVRSYRDNVGGGRVSFGRAMAVGSLIALISSACYVATWEAMYFRFAPEHGEKIEAYMMESARGGEGTPEEVQKEVAKMEALIRMYHNPLGNAAMTFMEPLPVALVFTLVSAGILSRRRRERDPGLVPAANQRTHATGHRARSSVRAAAGGKPRGS